MRQVSPAVRPDDVLSALGAVAGVPSSALVKAIRIAQGRLDDDGGLVDPLAADRAAARTVLVESGDEPEQHDVADIPVNRARIADLSETDRIAAAGLGGG